MAPSKSKRMSKWERKSPLRSMSNAICASSSRSGSLCLPSNSARLASESWMALPRSVSTLSSSFCASSAALVAAAADGPAARVPERLAVIVERGLDLDVVNEPVLTAEANELVDEPVQQRFVHGDLIPGNLLVDGGRLTAIIDWGGAGHGDPAQDLAPAWAVLTTTERAALRDVVGADDAAWIRGRTFELEHAVGGVLYYAPRRHPLGDVMARTLEHILSNCHQRR